MPGARKSCRLPTGNYVGATNKSEFRCFSDDVGGPFGPQQPVPRGSHLFRLEISNLAIDERLDDGGPGATGTWRRRRWRNG